MITYKITIPAFTREIEAENEAEALEQAKSAVINSADMAIEYLSLLKIKYDLLLKKSWMGMKNNLIVFLPLVYSIALGLVFLIMMLLEFLLFIGLLPDPRVELIRFLYFAVPIGLIDILLLILLTSVINAMYINLLNLVSRDYKATNKDLLQGIKKYAYLYFKVQMIKFSIILIPILILGLIVTYGFAQMGGGKDPQGSVLRRLQESPQPGKNPIVRESQLPQCGEGFGGIVR